jgi:hypothetical protein
VVDELSRNLFNLRDDNEAEITFIHFRELCLQFYLYQKCNEVKLANVLHFLVTEENFSSSLSINQVIVSRRMSWLETDTPRMVRGEVRAGFY